MTATSKLRIAYEELHGCCIRRLGHTCEVRKEFLAVALDVLASAIEARRVETEGLDAKARRRWNTRAEDNLIKEAVEALSDARKSLISAQRTVFETVGYSAAEIEEAMDGFLSGNPALRKLAATLSKLTGEKQ
jgi:hypothetical protein